MVVTSAKPLCHETSPPALSLGIPTIDMSTPMERDALSRLMVRACEEFGFFKAVNHSVPPRVTARLEAASAAFFMLEASEKQKAGPPTPLGYGCRNIGAHGDVGELEYLILHTNPEAVAQKAMSINRKDPSQFSEAVNEYVEAVRELASEILDLIGEGLGLNDPKIFSNLIKDTDSDSLLRINHYPSSCTSTENLEHEQCTAKKSGDGNGGPTRIGFGEHSDPQILSVLWANNVDGLQVLLPAGGGEDVWVQVPADPSAFFINVGDLLQVLTNGKLISSRHRVLTNSCKPRLSAIYFATPPLHARISVLSEMVTVDTPCQYRLFTWAEYKKAMYSLRLSYNRLNLFHVTIGDVGEGDKDKRDC